MGYGYTDYASMQQAAKRRVYEMQRRSRMAIEGDNEPIDKYHDGRYEKEMPENACERFYGFRNPECDTIAEEPQPRFNQATDKRLEKEDAECKEEKPCQSRQNDKLLIIALLMLFLSEGTNIQMIAVLLYLLTGE